MNRALTLQMRCRSWRLRVSVTTNGVCVPTIKSGWHGWPVAVPSAGASMTELSMTAQTPTSSGCLSRPSASRTAGAPEMLENAARFVRGKSAAEIGSYYQYQGSRTNDCGPFSLAMIINLQLGECRVKGKELGDLMQAASRGFGLLRYRFTSWMGQRRGATSPWGLTLAYRNLGTRLVGVNTRQLGRIRWRLGGSKDRLLRNVDGGVLSTLLLVWKGASAAHFATVVGYDRGGDRFLLLDSATGGDKSACSPDERVLAVTWERLETDWSRRPWWLLWQNRVMVEVELA